MGPLTKATNTLNCQAISPAPHQGSKKNSTTLTLCVCACECTCCTSRARATRFVCGGQRTTLGRSWFSPSSTWASLRQKHPVVFSLERDRGRHPPLTSSQPVFPADCFSCLKVRVPHSNVFFREDIINKNFLSHLKNF